MSKNTDDGSPVKILVVDDQPNLSKAVAASLSKEGYRCRTANNVDDAWQLLQQDSFSLVLSDIKMPGRSGLELLAMTRRRFPEVAIVMITAIDDRATAIQALRNGAFGYIIKPFRRNELLIGVANALERRRLALESQEYERLLEAQVEDRTSQVRRREEEIALRLVSAAEYRDEETGSHIRRMGLYAAALAEAVGSSGELVDDIRLAAPMHDIGKIGVPDTILLKPAKLTAAEFEVVKKHTAIGAGILGTSEIPLLRMAKEIALCHHERWDGAGYPRQLAGAAIPPAARIVAIADIYDALVTKRVYRPALPEEEALAIMTEENGTHLDPHLFERFLDVLPEFRRIRAQISEATASLAECPLAAG